MTTTRTQADFDNMLLNDVFDMPPDPYLNRLVPHHKKLMAEDTEYKRLFDVFSESVQPLYKGIPFHDPDAKLNIRIAAKIVINLAFNTASRRQSTNAARDLYKIYAKSLDSPAFVLK